MQTAVKNTNKKQKRSPSPLSDQVGLSNDWVELWGWEKGGCDTWLNTQANSHGRESCWAHTASQQVAGPGGVTHTSAYREPPLQVTDDASHQVSSGLGGQTDTSASIPRQHQMEKLTISTRILGHSCLSSDAARRSGETSQCPTGSPDSQLGVVGRQDPPNTAGFKGLAGQSVAGLSWGYSHTPAQHKLSEQGTTHVTTEDRDPQVWSLDRTLSGRPPGGGQTNVTSRKGSLHEAHTWHALASGQTNVTSRKGLSHEAHTWLAQGSYQTNVTSHKGLLHEAHTWHAPHPGATSSHP